MTQVFFIIGGGGGIGYQLVKLFASLSDSRVITTTENLELTQDLKQLQLEYKNIDVLKLVLSDEQSIQEFSTNLEQVVTNGIDVFISNSEPVKTFLKVFGTSRASWLKHYAQDVLGPISTFEVVYPYMKEKSTRKAIFLSSALGSIGAYLPFPSVAYGQSMASLNYTVKLLSVELDDENFTVVAVHPGLIHTEETVDVMNTLDKTMLEDGASFFVSPEQAAQDLVGFTNNISRESNSKFLDCQGHELTW